MPTSPNVLIYSAIDGWRRHMVERGEQLLGAELERAGSIRTRVAELSGLSVLRDRLVSEEASHDLDVLQVRIDVSDLEISGYQAADWLRSQHHIDMGLSDHRRILATLSMADDDDTTNRLVTGLADLASAAVRLPAPPVMALPDPVDLELDSVTLPRDAFFGPVEDVAPRAAVGRIAAEQITPYPPGIPVIVPGERINEAVVDYLLPGLSAGMVLPDPADPSLRTVRVCVEAGDPG